MVDCLNFLDTAAADFEARFTALVDYDEAVDPQLEQTVAEILADVRTRGDAALIEYTQRFDDLACASASDLELSAARIAGAAQSLTAAQNEALEHAAQRLRRYAERQKLADWSISESNGTELGQRVSALERVGLYVPGGKAAYPSSVLMNAIPAKVAGVAELVMVVPTPHGKVNDLVLTAARIAGVDRVFTIGGAQAIAALAYGTETVPAVDKIVGPGNAFVAAAKRQVFGKVGIDMLAGPSEILIVADGSTAPDWMAMDLFSQAEHDEDAQAILLCPDGDYLNRVADSVRSLLAEMPRREIIEASLARRGALIKVADLHEAIAIVNRILELSVAEPRPLLDLVKHAGAIFLGAYSAEALGDYCAGPNHVLPTAGTARFSSPLGVYDFQKRSSIIACSAQGARELANTAAELARGEGLVAHARSAEFRGSDER
jgi:histidinol dehydrogenase